MDRTRFSFIAHRHLEFCSPVGASRVSRAIELMDLPEAAQVVDFGAGTCGWLARLLAARPGARAVAFEPAALFADAAEQRHRKHIGEGRLSIVRSSAVDFLKSSGERTFDGALCIGSTHAFEDYTGTLEALRSCIVPGGAMVVAEGYWKQRPSARYLAVLGGRESEFTTHAGNIERALARGLTPRWACTVTDDEWDEYEWGYSRGIESFVRENPGDPDVPAMLERSRSWRRAYIQWGRDTLGFGLYVFGT